MIAPKPISTDLPRILIIGVGSIGERHLRCFQSTGDCVVAFCETNPELRAAIADRYGCVGFDGFDAALASGTFSGAVICTPAPSHIPIAARCVEAGFHVLIEKPLSTGLDGVDALLLSAEQANIHVRVAYIHRFLAPVQRAKELLLAGHCGSVRHVTVSSGQHFPTFRPAYRSIYYAKRESGGGAIQDALTHQIHAVEWLIGPARRVICHAAHQVLADVEVEDTVNLSLQLEDGALASLALNQFQAVNETVFSFHGTEGSLRVEMPANRVGLAGYGSDGWEWEQLPASDRDGPFTAQARDFLRLLNGGGSSASSLAEAKQTLMVNLAALRSAEEGCEVRI